MKTPEWYAQEHAHNIIGDHDFRADHWERLTALFAEAMADARRAALEEALLTFAGPVVLTPDTIRQRIRSLLDAAPKETT